MGINAGSRGIHSKRGLWRGSLCVGLACGGGWGVGWYATDKCGAHGVQKGASDALEWELPHVWASLWVLGTEPGPQLLTLSHLNDSHLPFLFHGGHGSPRFVLCRSNVEELSVILKKMCAWFRRFCEVRVFLFIVKNFRNLDIFVKMSPGTLCDF